MVRLLVNTTEREVNMLSKQLGKIKQFSILMVAFFVFLGLANMLWPVEMIQFLMIALGVILLIAFVLIIFLFIASKKDILHILLMILGFFFALIGGLILAYPENVARGISIAFGMVILLGGIVSMVFAWLFAKRKEKHHIHSMLFSCVPILLGLVIIFYPWQDVAILTKSVGAAMFVTALIVGITMIWSWQEKR